MPTDKGTVNSVSSIVLKDGELILHFGPSGESGITLNLNIKLDKENLKFMLQALKMNSPDAFLVQQFRELVEAMFQ